MRKETKILAILLSMILMYMGVFSKIAWMNVHADQEKIVPSSVDGFEYHIKTYESGYKEYECTTRETQIYHSYEEAVKGIAELSRRLIKEQKVKLFILSIPVEIKCDSKIKQIEDFSVDKEISKEIFKETGNPEDGYTLFMFASGGGNFLEEDLNNNPEYKDGSYKGIWHASACGYGDKTERYNQTVEKLDQVLKELDLDGKSDYEKCKEIMWWIAKNVKYDTHYNGSPEIPAKTKHPHDMTGAVLDGYCVCDGYAGVFYYMANAAGIPALYDDGKFYSGGHAWNLVQIDGKYYYIDLTGAAGNFDKDGNVNTEFLLGSDTYIMQKYTSDNDNIKNTYGDLISKDDYSKEHSVCKGNHDLFYEGKNGAQCDKFGCYLYRCKNKGCFYVYEEKIPALGHEWDKGTITQEQSCENPEITTYKCIRTDIWPTCKATKQLETKPSLGGHIWDNGKITKQATCTTAGEKTYTCTRCQQTKTEAIAKIPHEYEENVIKAPTCTSYGVSTYTCKNCGYTTSERSTKATGHQHTEIRNQRAATCERSGYTGDTYCNDCKKTIKMGTMILPTGHTWGDWEIFREPDCKYYGWKTHTCKTCNTTEGEIIEKLDTHQWDQGEITKKATCTEDGERIYHCLDEGCDKTYTETIPATGHQHTEIQNQQEATCTKEGYSGDIYCKDCKQVIQKGDMIKATGHEWDEGKVTKVATCKEEGTKTFTCKNCNETKEERIEKINHQWNDGEITKKATCTEDGQKVYTCRICQNTKEEVLKATGHQHTELRNEKEATCIEEGYSGDTYCTDCDQLIKEGEITPKTDHKWTMTSERNATCDEPGKRTYECEICHETKEESVVATGHQYGSWKVIKNQSVFTAKQQRHTCKTCGHQETKTIGKKLKPTLKTNAASLKLKRKQTTTRFMITGLAKGDYIRSLSSNNKKLVTITGNKKGTCKIKAGSKTGKAKITISLASGLKKTISVNVQKKSVIASKIKNVQRKLTLKKNQSYQLNPVIEPITCTEKVKYKSSNKKIIKVTSKGKIKAMKKGKGKITIIVGNKKITCKAIIK